MITIPTFILVRDIHTDKDVYINPTQIICMRPSRDENSWRVVFCNDMNIVVDTKGLKTITDHSEILVKKI